MIADIRVNAVDAVKFGGVRSQLRFRAADRIVGIVVFQIFAGAHFGILHDNDAVRLALSGLRATDEALEFEPRLLKGEVPRLQIADQPLGVQIVADAGGTDREGLLPPDVPGNAADRNQNVRCVLQPGELRGVDVADRVDPSEKTDVPGRLNVLAFDIDHRLVGEDLEISKRHVDIAADHDILPHHIPVVRLDPFERTEFQLRRGQIRRPYGGAQQHGHRQGDQVFPFFRQQIAILLG